MSKIKYQEIIDKTVFPKLNQHKENLEKYTGKTIQIPEYVTQNLKFDYRYYQKGAIENLLLVNDKSMPNLPDVDDKHNIFHMATGSGKTMMMASVVLIMYKMGYRKFIFLTQSLNLIEKTKNNLLPDRESFKLEFKEKIEIDGKNIKIKELEKFTSNEDDIEIVFKTVHSIHNEINIPRENSIDYSEHGIILLADEAHHFQGTQKNKESTEKTWEDSINHILNSNNENRLYEFTATLELSNAEIHDKYKDKIIYDYPLRQFRNDGFSKEVELIKMPDNDKEKILLSLIVSQFRFYLASKHDIPLIPRILFKCQGKVEEIEETQRDVVSYLDEISEESFYNLMNKFQKEDNIADVILKELYEKEKRKEFVKSMKTFFTKDSMIYIHTKSSSKDKEEKLKILNEIDENKNIRIIFAINILNEGWDVLSLYDIVKLDKLKSAIKETTQEAQLIGRGARLFPYIYKNMEKFKRKFDNEQNNPLRLLEVMYFYSANDNKYIEKLKESLIEIGLQDLEKDDIRDVRSVISQRKKLEEMIAIKGRPMIASNRLYSLEEDIDKISDYFIGSKTFLEMEYDLRIHSESLLEEDSINDYDFKNISIKDLVKGSEFIFNRALRKLNFLNLGVCSYSSYNDIVEELQSNDNLKNGIDIKITDGMKGFNKLNYSEKFTIILNTLMRIVEHVSKYKGKMCGSKKLEIESFIDDTFSEYTKNSAYCLDYGNSTIKEFHKDGMGGHLKGSYRIRNNKIFYYDKLTWDSEIELRFCKYLDDNVPKEMIDNILIIRNENENYKVYSTETDVNSPNLGRGFCPDFIILKRDSDKLYEYFIEVKGRQDTEEWKKDLLGNLIHGFTKEVDGVSYSFEGIDEFITGDNIEHSMKKHKILG